MRMSEFTKTEQRILRVLADGEAHGRDEFYPFLLDDCAGDERNLRVNLSVLISKIRKKLQRFGMTVMIEHRPNMKSRYRQVRLLYPVNKG